MLTVIVVLAVVAALVFVLAWPTGVGTELRRLRIEQRKADALREIRAEGERTRELIRRRGRGRRRW
jgi:hypothetical protein